MRFNRLLSYHRYDVQVKFPSDSDKKAVDDPAICLVCGRVLNAGKIGISCSFYNMLL